MAAGEVIRGLRRPRGDTAALAVLAVLPLAVVVGPALFGHLLAPGDDLTQNLPLRWLAGSQLHAGHLPVWDPWIWSGTPLLAGFNAGAFYPLTLLFAVLPLAAAWTAGLVVSWWVAAGGMYAFLRDQRLGPLAAAGGAGAFAYGGFMLTQVAHIGLEEGMGWVGWLLLAMTRAVRPGPRGRAAGIAGVAVAGGMVLLAGEPRAAANVAIVGACWAVALVVRRDGGRTGAAAALAVGALLAVAVGAAQYLPGLAAQAASQRSGADLISFGAGSLPPRWLTLMAAPFALGGFASLGQPGFAAPYNLTEVSGYLGLLGVGGALSALAYRTRALRHGPGVWGWLGLAGILLALGNQTPLGHLLYRIPLYGGQRLQSRNLGVVAVAGAVLFAAWLQDRVERRPLGRVPAAVAVVPAVVAVAEPLVALAWPGFSPWLGATNRLMPRMYTYAIASGLLALAAAATVRAARRAEARAAAVAVGVTCVDLGFFAANALGGWTSVGVVATHPAPGSGAAAVARLLVPGGRYLVFDPGGQYAAYYHATVGDVPVPDLGVMSALPSVQGYGSIVAASYQDLTGTHAAGLADLSLFDPAKAARLSLTLVMTPAGDLAVPAPQAVARTAPPGGSTSFYAGGVAASGVALTPAPPPGTAVTVRSGGARVRAEVDADGRAALGRVVAVDEVTVDAPVGAAVALTGVALDAPPVGRWWLSGFSSALDPAAWAPAGRPGGLEAFTARFPPVAVTAPPGGRATLAGGPAVPASRGAVSLVTESPAGGTVTVSEAYDSGWAAVAAPASGGHPRPAAVTDSDGLLGVRVPPGSWAVTLSYRPTRVGVGLAVTGAGLAVAAGLGAVGLRRRRRTRPR